MRRRKRRKELSYEYYREVLVELIKYEIGTPYHGAEIGVFKGETSAVLLSAFEHLHLTMVDAWAPYPEKFKGTHRLFEIRDQNEWNSLFRQAFEAVVPFGQRAQIIPETSEEAADRCSDRLFDFVFIDSNHCYECIKQDIGLWTPRTRTLICGHDYGADPDLEGVWGVKKAVDEAFGDSVRTHKSFLWSVLLK